LSPFLVGLISDTHGLLRRDVAAAFTGVDLILHAGDVGSADVLDDLRLIAPCEAVGGNVDLPDLMLPSTIVRDVGGLTVHVSHGNEVGSPTPDKLAQRYRADIIVFGHTHRAVVRRVGPTLVVNPGAAGPRRFHLKPSVARLTVDAGSARVEIVNLAD
jgi:putative phosphoesterase